MSLQASVLSSQSALNVFFDQQQPQTQVLEFPPVLNSEQDQQAVERRHLVDRIDDLCDCV
jgi:hypothetical protein